MVRPDFFIPFVFTLAAVFYALLGLYAWRKRPAVAVSSFAWAMLSMSVWSLTYGLEIFFPLLSTKLWIVNFEYIGIIGVPIFLFFFAMDYTGRNHLITRNIRAVILALYILILLLIWTNPLHHLMWDMESIKQVGALRLLSVRFGFAFWLHILFSYGLITFASIILIMDFLKRPGTLRLYISLVIIGILFSLSGTFAFALGFSPIPGIDFAPLFFLPTAIGLAWVTLQYRLSEILSLEHISVLKNMTDSVIVLNDQKRVLYINPVTENLLKRTEDEVIGQPFHMVAGAFAETLDLYLTGEEYHTEIQIGEADEERTYEAATSSISSASRDTNEIVISLRDVTKRKEKEQELRRRDLIMSAISRAAEQFLVASDWEENIADVLENLGLAADVSRVYVVVNLRDDHEVIYSSLKYEWVGFNIVSHMEDPTYQRVPLAEAGFERWIAALTARKPVFGLVKDFPENEAEFLHRWGSLAIAAVPIFVDQQWWGFIVFDETRHARQWNNMEVDAFQTAANILGAAESQSRTARALARRQMAMILLQDIVTAALQATNMRDMAEIVTNRLAQLIHADGCFLTLWDDINKQTIPFAAYGAQKQAYSAIEVEPDEITFTRSALDMERTLIIEDTGNTPHASPSITRSFPSKSVLVLPLIAMEKKLGAVLVSFDEYHRFEFDEVQICEQAASLIALALEKFQAIEDVKRRADTSETLRRAGIAVAEQLELGDTVTHILEQLKQMVPYDSASVQLRDGDELYIIGGHGWENANDILNLRFPIPGNNPNTVVIERETPYYLPDVGLVYPQFKSPPHDHIHSWLGIPLIVQDNIIGLLAVDSSKPNNFSEQEIMIAAEFANQVANTLENARILKETQTQAITDALTGVHNRRGLLQTGEFEFQRARRIHRPFSVLMFDIDHFKKINDKHGHGVGDQILIQLAKRCIKTSRATDLVSRYGGEEFVILLTETNLEAAKLIGERLRLSIMGTPFDTDAGEIVITTSIGVTESKTIDTLETLIERADAALYKAKNSGRNRVVAID